MATGWVRSVHCKSNVSDDVITPPKSKLLLPRSCTRSQALKDSIFSFHRAKPINPKTVIKSKTMPVPPSPPPPLLSASVPSIVQLPPDHPTHGVVQRIFLSSWSSNREASPFPGEIKIVFRIRHPIKALAQFEQYRAGLRARSEGSAPRCIADGNEMMCFHCPDGGKVKYGHELSGYKGCEMAVKGIRTFSGSGGAHESVGKDMKGKRAMLVCRLIAGRVRDGFGAGAGAGGDDSDSEFESVRVGKEEMITEFESVRVGKEEMITEFESVRIGKEEMIVFDPRALLPCFLIIYKL